MQSAQYDRILLRLEEIDRCLGTPEIASDSARFLALMKERKRIEPIVVAYRAYRKAEKEHREAEILAQETRDDAALREMALDECRSLQKKMGDLEEQLRLLLLPRDERDERNVIMEIRAGAGGEEAALFAADLFRMYCMYATNQGWRVDTIGTNETELGGFREISFMIIGDGAFSRLKYESGVHRVQRVPRTESQGRIQTSTVTVAVLPEAENMDVEINPADVVMETMKSSGAGGQHINKTESAIRLYHKPSGIVVFCQEERSQFKNRDKAMKMLRAKLYEMQLEKQNADVAATRRNQVGSGDRSEKIRTYNYPQSRVTDHRIGLTLYQLDSFLNGNIGSVIDALSAADMAERIKAGEDGDSHC